MIEGLLLFVCLTVISSVGCGSRCFLLLHFCCCFRFFVDSRITCRFWYCCVKFVSCLLPSSSKVHLSHFYNHFELLWFVNACTKAVSLVFLCVSVLVCHWISCFHLAFCMFLCLFVTVLLFRFILFCGVDAVVDALIAVSIKSTHNNKINI